MTFYLFFFVIQNEDVLCCKCGGESNFWGVVPTTTQLCLRKLFNCVEVCVCVHVRMCVCVKRKFVSDSNEVETFFLDDDCQQQSKMLQYCKRFFVKILAAALS